MSADEEFTRTLRDQIDAIAPHVVVDTSTVVHRARRRRRGTWGGGVAGSLVLVAGFSWVGVSALSGSALRPSGHATPSSTAQPPIAAAVLEARAQRLADLAAGSGLVDPPEVGVVRWIERAEESAVMAECLTAAGVPTVVDADGNGYSNSYPVDQEQAVLLVEYICAAQYPVPSVGTVVPAADLRAVYDFWSSVLVPCLGAQGYDIGVPTWESFRDASAQGAVSWDPWVLVRQAYGLPSEEYRRLWEQCHDQGHG